MARIKTAVDGPLIAKAQLDPIETAPAFGKGQPLRVTTWLAEKTSDVYLVKTKQGCYDFALFDINGWGKGKTTDGEPMYWMSIPQHD